MRSGTSYLFFFIFLFFLNNSSLPQEQGIKKYHPFSGKLGLSLEAGTTFTLSDFETPGWSYFGRFSTEYFFPSTQVGVFGLKGIAEYGYLSGSGGASYTRPDLEEFRTSFLSLGGGVEYVLELSKSVFPYVFVGATYLYFNPMTPGGEQLQRNAQKKYSKNEWSLIGEGGFKFMVSEVVSLNVGINMNYVNIDNLDDIDIGTDNDIFFTGFGGVTVYFLGIDDSDGDGISDDDDLCPNTPGGVIVDSYGCAVDTDNDGVPDYLDRCPNTPANVPVDTNGCLVDSDGDGVPDYLDLCRDTPVGIAVDKRGCALDEDNDGVPDYKDRCPDTPYGMEVDKFGCPIEVIEIEKPEITTMTLSAGVNFEIGSSKLLEGAKPELNKIINVIKKHPGTVWQISGYTDNTGSYDLNMKLSYQRASAVADYFTDYGISPSRLVVKGLGSSSPIADNSTESGRALNRRVVIELLSEEDQSSEIKMPVTTSSEYNVELERQIGNMIFTDGNLYCYQVAAFRKKSQAETEANRLRMAGQNAFVVEANIPELDGTWYRVRVGYFSTLSGAKESKKQLVK